MGDPQYKPVKYSEWCTICTNPIVQIIDGMKEHGYTNPQIEEYSKKNGLMCSSQLYYYHWKRHTTLIKPRHTKAMISKETMKLIDSQLSTPDSAAKYALNVVDKGMRDGELKPRTWRDAMETIRLAKDVTDDSGSTVYLQQLVQINNFKEEDGSTTGDNPTS